MSDKLGGEYANALMQIHNPFWRDVFKHYKKLNLKCMSEDVHAFMSECLHYNINITRDNRVAQAYVKECKRMGRYWCITVETAGKLRWTFLNFC